MFALDANVFMEAKNRYYAFDLVPRFWVELIDKASEGQVRTIDRVRTEIVRGKDQLADWCTAHFDHGCDTTDDNKIRGHFGEMMAWVMQGHFLDAAKAEFAEVADGWLIAYAKANGYTVVTHEQFNREVKRKVPIPNVCEAFGVEYINTFDMLRRLGVRFN